MTIKKDNPLKRFVVESRVRDTRTEDGWTPWSRDNLGDNPPRSRASCELSLRSLPLMGPEWALAQYRIVDLDMPMRTPVAISLVMVEQVGLSSGEYYDLGIECLRKSRELRSDAGMLAGELDEPATWDIVLASSGRVVGEVQARSQPEALGAAVTIM